MSAEPFRIIPPLDIMDVNLVSSSVPEDDFPVWNMATAYMVGDRVIRIQTHGIYIRLVAGTTSTPPENDPLNWGFVSATNRWKMFDTSNTTGTMSNFPISVVLMPNKLVNTVGVLGIVGDSVRVRIEHPTRGIIFDQTRGLNGVISESSWYAWFFDRVANLMQFVITDLQILSPQSKILIDVTPSTTFGYSSIGTFVYGIQRVFGKGINYGSTLGIIDYSRKETNEFGDTVLVKRAFSKRTEAELWVNSIDTDALVSTLTDLRATPALYITTNQYEATALFGTYRDWNITLSYPDVNVLNIQLESLT